MSDTVVTEIETTSALRAARVHRPLMRTVEACGGGARAARQLRRLRAVILLDGTVRRTRFSEALDRSLLELPLGAERVLLDEWRDEVQTLCTVVLEREVPSRIIVGRSTRRPSLRRQDEQAGMSVEFDPQEYRGTGGLLRDIAADYDEDDLLLVANAAQVLLEPLHVLAREAAEVAADVTVIANSDGTPASVSLMSCRALRELSDVGFVDLKEQGLPLISQKHDVRIVRHATACGVPIRTPADYLSAVRAHHLMSAGQAPQDQPFAERWQRHFSLVEAGSLVSADAVLHDSVVLRGAQIESGALVARSVVCAGAVIRKRESVVSQLVGAGARSGIESETR